MGKRTTILALLLSVMMLFVSGVSAFAAPSPRPEDLYGVDDEYEIENDDIPHSNFLLDIIVDQNVEVTDPVKLRYYNKVLEELEKILEFLLENNLIIDYFDDDIKELFAKLLPDGFDLETLEMNEFVPAFTINYVEDMGDVAAMFKFATEYQEGDTLVAFAGNLELEDEGDDDTDYTIKIVPLKAEVVRNKVGELRVKIYFTEEVLEAAGDNPFALGILNVIKED